MADPSTPTLDQMGATIARAVNTIVEQDFPGLTHGEKMRLLVFALAREAGVAVATIAANEDLEPKPLADLAMLAAIELGRTARLSNRLPNSPSTFDFRDLMKAKP